MLRMILFLLILCISVYTTMALLETLAPESSFLKNLFLSVVSFVVVSITIALVLGLFGMYHVWIVGVVLCCIVLFAWLFLRRKEHYRLKSFLPSSFKFKKIHFFIFSFVIFLVVIYTMFPTRYWFPGRDHGLYVVNGAHMAQTGAIAYESDPLRVSLYQELGDVLKDYPALYSGYDWNISSDRGSIIPQFMPLYFAATAIGYSLAGFSGTFYVNGVITLLSLGMFYILCEKIFNKPTAMIAVIFLALNPAQIWNGRIPASEMLAQLLLFCSFYIFICAWEKKNVALGLFTGFLMGLNLFCRIDSFIYGLGVYAIWLYALLFNRRKAKVAGAMALCYSLMGIAAMLYGWFYSRPYFIEHFENNTLNLILYANIIFAIIPCILFVALTLAKKMKVKQKLNSFSLFLDSKGTVLIFVTLLTGLSIFAYFIRPILSSAEIYTEEYFVAHAMQEFSWYSSLIAFPVALFGLFIFLKYSQENKRENAFFYMLIGFSSLLIYIYRPGISPDHYWASRRWVTICIPFLLSLSAYGCFCIGRYAVKRKKIARLSFKVLSLFLVISIVAFSLHQSSLFLFHPMLKDTDKQVTAMAEKLKPDAIYLAYNTPPFASALRYIYNLPVYIVGEYKEDFPSHINGRQVYILGQGPSDSFNTHYQKLDEFSISGDYPQQTWAEYTKLIIDWNYLVSLYQVEEVKSEQMSWKPVGDPLFYSDNRSEDPTNWISNGQEGYLLAGPNQLLEQGEYVCTWELELISSTESHLGHLDIIARESGDLIDSSPLFAEDFATNKTVQLPITFHTDGAPRFSYRVYTKAGVVLKVNSVSVKRLVETD